MSRSRKIKLQERIAVLEAIKEKTTCELKELELVRQELDKVLANYA